MTRNFFDVFRADNSPYGPVVLPEECAESASIPVVVIGEEMWRDRFESDPAVVGKTVAMNGTPFTIRMTGVLAGLALSRAALGVYGVAAFMVSQRTKERGESGWRLVRHGQPSFSRWWPAD